MEAWFGHLTPMFIHMFPRAVVCLGGRMVDFCTISHCGSGKRLFNHRGGCSLTKDIAIARSLPVLSWVDNQGGTVK